MLSAQWLACILWDLDPECLIFQGPAIEDGRLKIGDRLLEVNNVEMTGKSQSEAVALLKNLPLGAKVKIVVSRQEDVPETVLPRIIVSV